MYMNSKKVFLSPPLAGAGGGHIEFHHPPPSLRLPGECRGGYGVTFLAIMI